MVAVDASSILILGGSKKSDGVIFNSESRTVTRAINTQNFQFECTGNQYAVTSQKAIVALVTNNKGELHLVEVSKDGSQFNQLECYGHCQR